MSTRAQAKAEKRPRRKHDVMLHDGTMLGDLIDDGRQEVDLRVLSDPEIYRIELDRLFARSWIMVGHETEIRNAGDYVLRYIGEDLVIVSRQQDGSVAILLNVCMHRGMQVCRAERGNATTFKCPYHGWVYGQDGRLRGAPFESEMFGSLDKARLGLTRARVATLGGVIFGNFDPDAPSFDEFFGDFKFYLECVLCRTEGGLEVLGAPQRALIRANWKCPAEQGSVDGYHAIGLHQSFRELGFFGGGNTAVAAGLVSIDVSAAGGGLRCFPIEPSYLEAIVAKGSGANVFANVTTTPEERLRKNPPIGMTPEMVSELRKTLSPAQLQVLSTFFPSVGQAFPTFEFLLFHGPATAEQVGPVIGLHSWCPKGPDAFEIWTWVFAEKNAPQAMKDLGRKAALRTIGSSGMIESDDGEAWPSQTRSARGAVGARQKFRYLAFHGHNPPEGWPGPGMVHTGITRDDGQWLWWQRYFRFMLGEE
ncbi:MAG: aromatic ring-hydroxylating oxygenase subunit alpha [Candidatus Binatia bacterium]